jgi:Type III restriction enzyme, res subunit
MTTGSGKTYTAVNFVYRLIKLAGARRVLFLVDQTLKEFQQFVTPDDGRKFTELYNVQHLQSAQLDRVSRVCISTIQRLYFMLRSLLFGMKHRGRRAKSHEETGRALRAWHKARHRVENESRSRGPMTRERIEGCYSDKRQPTRRPLSIHKSFG